MEIISKDQWLNALFRIQNGGRLNQLLSLMSGGEIEYVDWNDSNAAEQWDATGTAHMVFQGLPQEPVHYQDGLVVLSAYACAEDFHQEDLEARLRWLQQTQSQSDLPVRMVLLAFCRDNFDTADQPGMLTEEQWEELLQDGIALALGMRVELKEVIVLPMVAYQNWLKD